MNYQELSQKEINKVFLQACKKDDIELVKYLLTSNELSVKAQLNISKQTGFANEDKNGFVPLIFSVQYNSKKVYKYFIEEIKWFSTLNYEGKLEVLGKGCYPNDVETIDYLFKKFEESTKINEYQKPFLLNKILGYVIDKNSSKVFDYFMSFPKEYKTYLNTKNDELLRRAAKTQPEMLTHMLNSSTYENLSSELYLMSLDETKKNSESALILFKYGIEKEYFDIWLTRKAQSYIRDKVKDNVFKRYDDSLIQYIHEEHIKRSYSERTKELANDCIRDYFYTEDEFYKNKNNQVIAPVLEYAIKNNLLSKETREKIILDIVKHEYKNLLNIISQYPKYGEGLDLNESFINILEKGTISKDKYEKVIQILNLDIDKNLIVWAKDFLFFNEMESIKSFGQNYDEIVKKTFVDYYFWSDEKLKNIYEKNEEMTKVIELKDLNMKLSNESEKIEVIKTKSHKI